MYRNPYKILNSSDFDEFIQVMDTEKLSPSKEKHTLDERLFNSNFYGLVGLKFFALYPSAMNFLQRHELSEASKNFLRFQFECLRNGASIDKEICINILFFIGIGYKMEEIANMDYALSCVPTFLIKIIKNFSIEQAQKDMAEKYEIKQRQSIYHCTSSVLCLLAYYYQIKRSDVERIRDFTTDILNAFNSSINIRELMNISFPHILNFVGCTTILELYEKENFIVNYKPCINNNKLIENIRLYCEINKEKMLSEAKSYNTFISDDFLLDENDYDENISKLKNNYFRFICPNYKYLLCSCIRCYDDMMRYNIRMKKWTDINMFDHLLVYYLAAWIKENRKYKCVDHITKKELARDITYYILHYQIK